MPFRATPRTPRQALRLILATFILLAAPACTRAMHVGSDPAPVYRLLVSNQLGEAMLVSYNDGSGDRLLGSVPAGRSDSFVVAGSASADISVSARNSAGTRSAGPWTVRLVAGEQVTVQLR